MDSLGGILIKGLLGNPILAQFRLFLDVTIEEVVTDDWTGGRSRVFIRGDEQRSKTVKITIRYKNMEYAKVYTLTERMLKVTINTINYLNTVKDRILGLSVKLKEKKVVSVKVKRNDD